MSETIKSIASEIARRMRMRDAVQTIALMGDGEISSEDIATARGADVFIEKALRPLSRDAQEAVMREVVMREVRQGKKHQI